jgi:hypothetical protein
MGNWLSSIILTAQRRVSDHPDIAPIAVVSHGYRRIRSAICPSAKIRARLGVSGFSSTCDVEARPVSMTPPIKPMWMLPRDFIEEVRLWGQAMDGLAMQ